VAEVGALPANSPERRCGRTVSTIPTSRTGEGSWIPAARPPTGRRRSLRRPRNRRSSPGCLTGSYPREEPASRPARRHPPVPRDRPHPDKQKRTDEPGRAGPSVPPRIRPVKPGKPARTPARRRPRNRPRAATRENSRHGTTDAVNPADRLPAHANFSRTRPSPDDDGGLRERPPRSPVTARNPAPGLRRLKPTITATRRAVIWPIHPVASVPAIMGIRSRMASTSCIFIQAMLNRQHRYCRVRCVPVGMLTRVGSRRSVERGCAWARHGMSGKSAAPGRSCTVVQRVTVAVPGGAFTLQLLAFCCPFDMSAGGERCANAAVLSLRMQAGLWWAQRAGAGKVTEALPRQAPRILDGRVPARVVACGAAWRRGCQAG
jgi:hypothetical protein